MSLSTVVATTEARRGAPGFSWVRLNFYSFPLSADDIAGVTNGDILTLERKWNAMANRPREYNTSHAVIELSVDAAFKVWQVDMSVPGHSCTIAPDEPTVRTFLQDYAFDGKRLKLKSKGSHICDMKFMGVPDQTFAWQIDVDIPVFKKLDSQKSH